MVATCVTIFHMHNHGSVYLASNGEHLTDLRDGSRFKSNVAETLTLELSNELWRLLQLGDSCRYHYSIQRSARLPCLPNNAL